MQTLHFSQTINAPVKKVWDVMLADKTYREWTALFMAGSHFEGNWEQGSKMLFISTDENGMKGGMTSIVEENRPYEYLSLHHVGVVTDGVEDTASEDAKKWEGYENYTFKELGDNKTELIIDVDSTDDFADYMNETWPKALQKLKEIAEQ